MIGYVTIGVDDIALAKRFYSAFLPALGYQLTEHVDGLAYALPDQPVALPELYVKTPFDGRGATCGNGAMVAFEARRQEDVRRFHSEALAAGGTDEGGPGFRDAYSADFYVAYLRDPQGNKIAIYSNNPSDPTRDD